MRDYRHIVVWENNQRVSDLETVRGQIVSFFDLGNDRPTAANREKTDSLRTEINKKLDLAVDIINAAGVNSKMMYTAPAVVGGQTQLIDVVYNVFNLSNYHMPVQTALDVFDRAIGIYENDKRVCKVRTFNPFFYLGWGLTWLSDLPFRFFDKLGFDSERARGSILGRLLRGVVYVVGVVASFLTVLQVFDSGGEVKKIVLGLVGR